MHEEWLSLFVKRYKTPNIPRQVGGLVSLARVLHNHPAWQSKNKIAPNPCPIFFWHSQRLSFWLLDISQKFPLVHYKSYNLKDSSHFLNITSCLTYLVIEDSVCVCLFITCLTYLVIEDSVCVCLCVCLFSHT